MANPVSAVDGTLVSVKLSDARGPDNTVILEELTLRPKAGIAEVVTLPNVQIPEALANQFGEGSVVRLALYGTPSIRSHFLGGNFDDTTYICVPKQFSGMRRTCWILGLTLDALAVGCLMRWHLWGIIPAAVLAFLALGPERMAMACPTFKQVKRLLAETSATA